MKNKFEALTAFQQWPEDWQRLCAEYWAENDRPKGGVTTSLHPMWAELHKHPVEPDAVAKFAEAVNEEFLESKKCNDSCGLRWTPAECEFLQKCVDESNSNAEGIRKFIKRNKNKRTFRAAEQRLQWIQNNPSKVYN